MNEHAGKNLQVGGLDVLSAGLNLAELDLHGGDGLWTEVARYVAASSLEARIDTALGGRAAPRLWAFIEAPGTGQAAAAAALGAAWLLAERGQMVVVVDADEQDPRLTRWTGRIEQEGWIDMVRFGASLHAASAPLPAESRRGCVVGVGTFAPTGVTPDEVAELLVRLRRQADDLILVLPAKLRAVPWLEAVHIRLLCWDLLARGAADTERIIAELDRMGARPDALLGFGVEEFQVIQERLQEAPAEAAAVPPPPVDVTPPDVAPPVAAPPVADREPDRVPAAEAPPVERESETDAAPEPATEPAARPAVAAAPFAARPVADEEEPVAPRRRTSPVFVILAAAAVVAIALLGLFLRNQRIAGPDTSDVAMIPVVPADPGASARLPVPGDGAGSEVAFAEPDATAPVEERTIGETLTAAEPESEPIALPAASPASIPDPAFDRAPYEVPAGQDGWALWLFSFPQESLAASEVTRLERLGLGAVYRAVELPDRGRWFRVYAGSFATRAAAGGAADALKAHLKHDWAQPARF